MTSVRRRALAAAALTVTAGLTLSACGTGFDAQTNKVYQPAVGSNARGEVDVLNALLVANPDGSATVSAGVVSNADAEQTVTSVEVTTLDDKPLQVQSPTTSLALKPGVFVLVGSTAAGEGFKVKEADTGLYVKVTFTFSDSSPVTIEAPVVARTAEYDDITGAETAASTQSETDKAESDAAEAETEEGPTGEADAR